MSATSSSEACATLRPAAPSGSSRRSPPRDCLHDTAASRTADSTPAAARGSVSQRPGGRSSSTSARPSPASTSRSATAWSTSLPHRRAAAVTAPVVSSAVATPVIRSTSSCASSTITTSCSGSTGRPSSASMASSAWLVTTTSARPASARAFSAKQSSPTGQRDAPRHSRALTDTCRHADSGTPGTSSSRSPVVGVAAPLVDALDRAAQRGDRERVEELIALVHVVAVAVQLVQAQVVAAALEDRERRRPPEQRLERLRQPGQVAVDELALQRDRRGRDDDGGAALDGVPDRRHEVGQRLARAGARLHRQVLARHDRPRGRPGPSRPGRRGGCRRRR